MPRPLNSGASASILASASDSYVWKPVDGHVVISDQCVDYIRALPNQKPGCLYSYRFLGVISSDDLFCTSADCVEIRFKIYYKIYKI